MKGLLLDTHIWIWLSMGVNLTPTQVNLIKNYAVEASLYLSSISIWELAMLDAKKRITINTPINEWIKNSIKNSKIQTINLEQQIAVESCNLPGNFHADPADRIIVATARVHELSLISRDKNIIKYGAKNYLRVIAG